MMFRPVVISVALFLACQISAWSQSQSETSDCFDRLFATAENWESRDSFIRAISHYDAARACPDVTREQDSRARQRANEARIKWEGQLRRQIAIADEARSRAEDSTASAIRARAFAEAERQRAIRAQRQAVKSARSSEAGRLALEADEETDLLLSTNSTDEKRKNDALMAAYWGMRWAGDTLQTEVTRAFGNAVYLYSRVDHEGAGAMGVDFDNQGRAYLMSRYDGTTVLSSDGNTFRLQGEGLTSQMNFNTENNEVATMSRSSIHYWEAGSSTSSKQAVTLDSELMMPVAFSQSAGLYAAGGRDGKARVWGDAGRVRLLEGHTAPITHVEFSPEGSTEVRILTVSKDKTARVWTSRGVSVGTPELKDHIIKASFIADERVALISGGNVIVWDINDGDFSEPVIMTHEHLVSDMMLTRDGQHVITLEVNGIAHRWTMGGAESAQLPLFGGGAMGLMRFEDDRCAAWSRNGNIAFFSDEMEGMEATLDVQTNVQQIIVSPTGRYFISVGAEGSVTLWDQDRVEWMSPPRFDGFVWAAGFSPDETKIWASTRTVDKESTWICPMPNLEYADMRNENLRPDREQVRRFNMRTEIPSN